MAVTVHVTPISLDKELVYTVRQFAAITEKSDQTIINLVNKGNRIRKLKAIKIGRKVFIKASELTEFPFTCSGKSGNIYYYNKNGSINEQKSTLQ
ncbi:MAG: helix-turn-helix domain-containing protein [Candidatus Thorarchaeota archaeon]|nr:helix-turn-helix domain-containing protein [Candidatus Thorarchaeota archaeon]